MNSEGYKPLGLGGSIYDEEVLAKHLNNISALFNKFSRIIDIKESFAKKLSHFALNESDFDNLAFDSMKKYESLSGDSSVEEFLRGACIGCEQAMLCLETVNAVTNTSKDLIMLLDEFIGDAISGIEHILKERGSPIPNFNSLNPDYQSNTLDHLTAFTDRALRGMPNYEQLKKHLSLIKDFKLVCEINDGFEVLIDEFGKLKMKQLGRDAHHVNVVSELMLDEVEITDLSGVV